MSYAVGEHFEKFIKNMVLSGRYNNASEVVREGLRLVEEREAKLKSLKDHLNSALERGGSYNDQEMEEALKANLHP